MNIIIHRGTHQIGGSAIEISTASTRIILDFGNELSLDEKYTPINLDIDGVTKGILDCDGIVISHYHMDHLGQLTSALPEIPLYMGELSKEVAMIATEHQDKVLYLGGGTNGESDNSLFMFKHKFSKSTLPFYIAGKIYDEKIYKRYCKIWQEQSQKDVKIFLKYRA